MRRLDFQYKKRTQIPSKTSKVNLTRSTGVRTSGLKLHQVALLYNSCRSRMASDHDGPKSKVVDLAMEKNSSVDHFFIRGHLDVEIGLANLQIILKFQFSGRTTCKLSIWPGSFARNFRAKILQQTVLALTFSYELRFRCFYIKIDRLDETKTIRVERFLI